MIETLWELMPGITSWPTFLMIEVTVIALSVWWILLGVQANVHQYKRPKSYKLNQFDYFKR